MLEFINDIQDPYFENQKGVFEVSPTNLVPK